MPFKEIEETHIVDADGHTPMTIFLRPSRRWDFHGSTSDSQRCLTCPANGKNGGLKWFRCTGVDPKTGNGSLEYSNSVRGSNSGIGNETASQTACGVRINELEYELELTRVHKQTDGRIPRREEKTKRQVWYPNPRS